MTTGERMWRAVDVMNRWPFYKKGLAALSVVVIIGGLFFAVMIGLIYAVLMGSCAFWGDCL
jgi:hypothetical protein